MQPMDTSMDNVWTAYKLVAYKVKPVPGIFPEYARVERKIPEDPLLTLPPLPMDSRSNNCRPFHISIIWP